MGKFNKDYEIEEVEADIKGDEVILKDKLFDAEEGKVFELEGKIIGDEVIFNEDEMIVEVEENEKKNKSKSKLTKEEEKIVKDLKIEIPPYLRESRTKVQLIEYWKAIVVAIITIVLFFLFFQKEMINIWFIRGLEIILVGGIIFLSERLYKNFSKNEFLLLLEIILFTFALLLCTEMIKGHVLFNGNTLLILSFCYIIYFVIKGIIKSRVIYVEYMRSRSDIREILKDNRKSYI